MSKICIVFPIKHIQIHQYQQVLDEEVEPKTPIAIYAKNDKLYMYIHVKNEFSDIINW